MKRSMKIAFAVILIILIPSGIIIAQDKKEQQKIKIVTVDKSGTKVIIDTVFNNAGKVDSITLIGGKVIYIGGKHDGVSGIFTNSGEKSGQMYVTVTDDGKESDEMKKEIKVIIGGSGKKAEKTSYILAKDGMTITIEGDDEAKIKEMVNVIEAKSGTIKGEKVEKVDLKDIKEGSKKTVKK